MFDRAAARQKAAGLGCERRLLPLAKPLHWGSGELTNLGHPGSYFALLRNTTRI